MVLVSLLIAAGQARAESARSLVARGNDLYGAKKFDEARKVYEEALAKDKGAPEIWYDLGNARYQLGDFPGAAEAYRQAAGLGQGRDLITKSEFNLGNTAFRQGEAAEAKDPEAASQAFEESVGHFRAALEQDAAFKEAGRNLEVTKRRLQKVRQEMKARQEAKEEEKRKQEEMAKELGEMADQQQSMAANSKQQAEKQQEAGQQAPGQEAAGQQADNQAMAEEAGAQQALQDKTQALRQKLGQTPEQEKAGKELDQASQQQQKAGEHLKENQPREASRAQEEAAQAMRQAQHSLQGQENKPPGEKSEDKKGEQPKEASPPGGKEEQAKNEGAEGAKPMPPPGKEDGPGKESEAKPAPVKPGDQTAQELLNEEKQNAIQRRSQGTSGVEAVDKDW
jgi:Ca-activated chloride channel family protein